MNDDYPQRYTYSYGFGGPDDLGYSARFMHYAIVGISRAITRI